MNVSWLTFRDLEYVIAVAKYEHFGRAAKACCVSQPSLSTQIKKIEGHLGVILFERNNRHVATTREGRKVAEIAASILDQALKIPSVLGEEAALPLKILNLGVISSLSPFIPYVLNSLKKTFQDVPLSLREDVTDELVGQLKSGALDAVIAADTVKDNALRSVPLFFEPFVLAAPKDHLILRKSDVKPSDLRASEMVLLEEGHCLREQAIHLCPTNRRGNPKVFHANSIETLRHLVASGAGYTLLPKLAAKGKPMSNLITYIEFQKAEVGRQIVLICRGQKADQRPFDLLTQCLRKSIPADLSLI